MKDNNPDKVVLNKLESLSRDELNVVAKKIKIKSYRRLDQATLITVLADTDNIRSELFPRWWAIHHNHVYFALSIAIALLLFFLQSIRSEPDETEKTAKRPMTPPEISMNTVTTIGVAKTSDPNTVAVLYFEDLSADNEKPGSLSKVLCTMMISFLSASDNLTIVERVQIQKVYAELNLASSKRFNQATVAKIGELLGARYLVFGSYFFYEDTLRIDARLVDVETGATVVSEGANGGSAEFTKLLSGVSEKILDKVGQNANHWNREFLVKHNLPKKELEEIGAALDQMDLGQIEPGIQRLVQLKEKHPDFSTLISTIISQNIQEQ